MSDPRGVRTEAFDPEDLSALFGQWDKIQEIADRLEQVERNLDPHALTARRFDEAKPAGHRGYTVASAYIGSALEHIHTIRHLFTAYGATPRVPWTLLRSVYEAGFWSTWLLEPADSDTRRIRGLRAEVNAARERTNFYATWFAHDPVGLEEATTDHPAHEMTYKAEAAALGIPWSRARDRIKVVEELAALEFVKSLETAPRDALNAIWRSLSGMQHGYAYAMVLNSDVLDREETEYGIRGVFTIKESAYVAAASSANMLLVNGMDLMIRRTISR